MDRIKLGLLGNGIGRSRAKYLHELIGSLYGLQLEYLPMDLAGQSRVRIQDELERCRREGFQGVNVTHPYKRKAFNHVEPLPGFPSGLTSVNTVLFEPGATVAGNTDYSGFCHAFRSQYGETAKPGRVMMFGAGGVGLAIAFGLNTLSASELIVVDNSPENAAALTAQLRTSPLPLRSIPAQNRDEIIATMAEMDGLINATPIGMYQYPGNPFPEPGIGGQQWAFDAVYTPVHTEFLRLAGTRGLDILTGFKLFLYQGLDAFELFCGMPVNAEAVETAFLNAYPLDTE